MTMLANRTETRVMTLADYEARIHLYKEQIGVGYIGIGRTLLEAKEAKVVPHGQWEAWVTETTGLTPRQAQRCMQAATEIKDGTAMARLEMSKAMLLLSSGLDSDQQEAIAGRAAEDGATVKELKEEIRQTKLKLVQETGAAAEIRNALRKAEEERDGLEQQIRARESAYQERLEEAREDAYKRGEMAGGADAAKEIRQLRADLENNRRLRQSLQDQLDGERDLTGQKISGLRDELDKQTKRADELEKVLDRREEEHQRMLRQCDEEARAEEREKMAAAAPAEYEKDREILLAAAEDAEKRAADAEAELEALRAGNGQDSVPPSDKVSGAVFRFLSECGYMIDRPEVLRRADAQSARSILCNVDVLQSWCESVYDVLDGTVEAEGVVE